MTHDYSEDISNAKTVRSALELEEDALKFAFKASNVGYWVWDTQTGHVYLSDTSLEMLQLSKTTFSNDIAGLRNLIHPDDIDDLKTSLRTHIKDNRFFEIEFRARRRDSSYIWLNIDGRAMSEDTCAPHRVGGSVVDATTYVKLKEQLDHEKRNLRLIFDNVPARIWLKDSHNRILRLNKTAAESMNIRIQDAEGADTYDLFPDLAADYHKADLAVIESNRPLTGIVEKYTPKDAPHGWVSTDKLPFTHPETGEKYVLVIATDITQQKQYEIEILEHSTRLDKANKDLDHFAYMASHDLKAPLRGMEELTKWIVADLGDAMTPDVQKKIDLLRGRVNRMDGLLKDILAFSRAGKNMADPEDVDINNVIDTVTDWLSPIGNFLIETDTALPVLNLPRSAVEHIFLNLISNAIKHHDRDEGTINIGCTETEDHYHVYVSDDGPGIPEKYQKLVFEIFKKLKPRDQIEGSGIGLSIVQKMVEALGGKIDLVSRDGERGTTFNIHIPKG